MTKLPKLQSTAESTTHSAMTAPMFRPGTKHPAVVELLNRDGGTSLADLIATTGRLPLTVLAALTGLRKHSRTITHAKVDDDTRYSIVAS